MHDVFLLSATRSAIGSFGGTLKETPPIMLGTQIASSAIERSGLAGGDIDHAVFGHVLHTETRDMYSPRVISVNAGLPESAPALQVNRLCGSGLQAIVSATQLIQLGDSQAALAGGVEVMSRGAYILPQQRWGGRMGDGQVQDMMIGALTDPFGIGHMGITAENVAKEYDISRDEMDQFALRSHQRAAAATEAGYFKAQITKVDAKMRRKSVPFDTDEHIRGETSIDELASLRAVFDKEGIVTAGNSSGINDGAAALVLANGETVRQKSLSPMAKIVSYGFGGVPARIMGMGPVPASQRALDKAGLNISDLAVIESNEAFAAQACAVSKQLGLPEDIVNPNGGAIALGHPIGATGAILMTKLVYELKRIDARYGMATMCIGGGQGISVIIENLSD